LQTYLPTSNNKYPCSLVLFELKYLLVDVIKSETARKDVCEEEKEKKRKIKKIFCQKKYFVQKTI
jgi:hypothetical protein